MTHRRDDLMSLKLTLNNFRIAHLENHKGNEVKNQFVFTSDTLIHFHSYSSPIISLEYQTNTVLVHPKYKYSVTTSKWRNHFLNTYDFSEIADTKSLDKAIEKGYTVDDKGNQWKVIKEVL